MTRPAARQSANIQQEAPAPAVVAPADAGSAEAPKAARPTLPWRVALFIWTTAFLCLLAYELLTALVRSLTLPK